MKDNLFELLMNLFDSRLTDLHACQILPKNTPKEAQTVELQVIQSANDYSTRVFIHEEQLKLTKKSHQFLERMKLLGVLNTEIFELIMNQLTFSDSNRVTLQETKWTIRQVLTTFLDEQQLAFLDLILYQKEDELIAH